MWDVWGVVGAEVEGEVESVMVLRYGADLRIECDVGCVCC